MEVRLRQAGYTRSEIKSMEFEEVVELYEVAAFLREREEERWLAAQTT